MIFLESERRSVSNDVPYYEREGKRYTRISHILEYFSPPELVDWKIRVGKKEAGLISRAALRIGENTDEAIRAEVEGRTVPRLKTLEAQNCFEAYKSWRNDYSAPGLRTVGTVYNDELMVAGTPDLLYGPDTVIDIKCSAKIRPNYWLQTEFYARCIGYSKKAICRLDKSLSIYDFRTQNLSDEHWAAVCGLVAAYRFYHPVTDEGKEANECDSTSVGIANAT